MTVSKPDYFPKAPSPNAITLEVRASTYGWGGGMGHNSVHSTPLLETIFICLRISLWSELLR